MDRAALIEATVGVARRRHLREGHRGRAGCEDDVVTGRGIRRRTGVLRHRHVDDRRRASQSAVVEGDRAQVASCPRPASTTSRGAAR